MLKRTFRELGCWSGRGLDLRGGTFSKRFELIKSNPAIGQISVHHRGLIEHPQRRSKSDPIKAAKNRRDMLAKFAIETLWNAVWYWYGLVLHPPFLPTPRRSNTHHFWLRLRRAATFCKKICFRVLCGEQDFFGLDAFYL